MSSASPQIRIRVSVTVVQVTALDLYPMSPSVWQCDFLQCAVTEGGALQGTEAGSSTATSAPAAAAAAAMDSHTAAGSGLGCASTSPPAATDTHFEKTRPASRADVNVSGGGFHPCFFFGPHRVG